MICDASVPHPHRLGALALAAAGMLFILYPVVRPWEDEATVDGATAAMVTAHDSAIPFAGSPR
ncbi:MAG TPA: hypothetical protein VFR67_11640 [Pilimelia sp.]|nr:hypothetical protein [Pilimelia sp.]